MTIDQEALKEAEVLVKKHNKIISAMDKALKENAAFGEGLSAERKAKLATMLENTNKIYDLKAPKMLTESGTQVTDIAKKYEYLNLVAATMATLVAEDVVSVQPLKQKAGVCFYMKHIYDSNRGAIKAGDRITDFTQVGPDSDKIPAAFDYSSEHIADEEVVMDAENKTFTLAWKPVLPGTVTFKDATSTYTDDGEGNIVVEGETKGTVDYATGLVTMTAATTITDNLVTYDQDLFTAPVNVPAIKTQIADVTLTARPRKLKTGFSMDAARKIFLHYLHSFNLKKTICLSV